MQAETSITSPPFSLRALGRVDSWWSSKVAPVFGVAYCGAVLYHTDSGAALESFLVIATVGLCAGTYGHLVNDSFDIGPDRLAGKRNSMANRKPQERLLLCLLALALGFLPLFVMSHSATSLWLLCLEYLLPTIYSAPPFRLKERRSLGLLCDCLGAHVIPSLFVLSVMARSANLGLMPTKRSAVFVLLVILWSGSLGIIGIAVHEFEDRESDLAAGVETFATTHTFQGVRRALSCINAVELLAFAGIVALMAGLLPILALTFLIFCMATAVRLSVDRRRSQHLPPEQAVIQRWQLSHSFYEVYLPLAALLQCSLNRPFFLIALALHVAAFAPRIRKQARISGELGTLLLLRGQLDTEPSVSLRVRPVLLPVLSARLEIQNGGLERWSIRLIRHHLTISAGKLYVIRLQARADRHRKIAFGVWQDHEPWDSAGYYEDLQLTREWVTINRCFLARRDEKRAYLGLWLGGCAGAVTLKRCSIRPLF